VRKGTGTITIGALAILIGFHHILRATVLDVDNEPGRGGREPHRPRRNPLRKRTDRSVSIPVSKAMHVVGRPVLASFE